MSESLHILILEDNPADAELIQFELEEAGLSFIAKVVMYEKDFVRELQEFAPDLILSDYDLPKYNGALALAEANRRCPDTPFILVTGAIVEDRAIEILTQGAKDYVLKNRLQQRLAPAVERALAEAGELRARKRAEAELREAHAALEEKVRARTAELEILNRQLRALFDYSTASLVLFNAKHPYTVLIHNKYYQQLWDEPFRTNGMVGKNLLDYVPAAETSGVMAVYDEVVQTKQAKNLLRFPYDGMPCGRTWWNWHLSPIMLEGEVVALAHMGIDVTKEVTAIEELERRTKEAEAGKATLDALMTCIPEGITISSAPDALTTMVSKYGRDLLLTGRETAGGLAMEDWLAKVEHYLADGHTPAEIDDLPLWRAVKYGETVESKELKLRRPTGEWLPVLCNAAPILDKDGHITGGIVAWRDISKIKEYQEALQRTLDESERNRAYLEAVILAQHDVVIMYDTQRNVKRVNAAFVESYGFDPTGLHVTEIIRRVSCRSLDGRPLVLDEQPTPQALTGKKVTAMVFLVSRADGTDGVFEVSSGPIRQGDQIIGAVTVWHDITERKRNEEMLRESEERFRSAFDNSAVAMALTASDGKLLMVNAAMCQLVGYSEAELRARSFIEITHPDDLPVNLEGLRSLNSGKISNFRMEKRYIHKDGRFIWADMSTSTLRDDQGNIRYFITYAQDIIERKRIEDELRKANAQLQALVKERTPVQT
jgi:PAS domain S-box-containing protein